MLIIKIIFIFKLPKSFWNGYTEIILWEILRAWKINLDKISDRFPLPVIYYILQLFQFI